MEKGGGDATGGADVNGEERGRDGIECIIHVEERIQHRGTDDGDGRTDERAAGL